MDLNWLLLLAPQGPDDDRTADVAVLEHHEDLIIDLGEDVRASARASHRDGNPSPERPLLLVEPRKLELDAIAGIAVAVLVVHDDRQLYTSNLRGAESL